MKKIGIAMASLLMMFSLTGCFGGDDNADKDVKKDATENKDKVKNEDDGNINDMMSYMKDNGIEYSDDKALSNFDWAAKEGSAFTYNGENVYLYKVDPSDTQVSDMMSKVKQNNMVTANQNGQEMQYAARVNGNYLMVYNREAALDELTKIFDKYKYEVKDDAK